MLICSLRSVFDYLFLEAVNLFPGTLFPEILKSLNIPIPTRPSAAVVVVVPSVVVVGVVVAVVVVVVGVEVEMAATVEVIGSVEQAQS